MFKPRKCLWRNYTRSWEIHRRTTLYLGPPRKMGYNPLQFIVPACSKSKFCQRTSNTVACTPFYDSWTSINLRNKIKVRQIASYSVTLILKMEMKMIWLIFKGLEERPSKRLRLNPIRRNLSGLREPKMILWETRVVLSSRNLYKIARNNSLMVPQKLPKMHKLTHPISNPNLRIWRTI